MIKVFGIKNCDTVKKTLKLLSEKKCDFDFHDFKKELPTKEDLFRWKKFTNDWPVNKRGRTFRAIQSQFDSASDEEKISILLENTSAIKRPILENNGQVLCLGHHPEIISSL